MNYLNSSFKLTCEKMQRQGNAIIYKVEAC